MTLLSRRLSKYPYKKLVKSQILDFWEEDHRKDSTRLTSMSFFKLNFYLLSSPHPIFHHTGSFPHHVSMVTLQAWMISGRYSSDYLCRHRTLDNKHGHCTLPTWLGNCVKWDLEHMLVYSPAVDTTRQNMASFTNNYATSFPLLIPLLNLFALLLILIFVNFW